MIVAPRPVRNCNPGDLRTGIQWDGLATAEQMTPEQRAEKEFCVFVSPVWGFRALALNMRTSWSEGRKSIAALIARFAPKSENYTAAYIRNVSAMMGVEPNAPLNLDDRTKLAALCRAIAVQESGGWFFNNEDLNAGVSMVLDPPLDSAQVA